MYMQVFQGRVRDEDGLRRCMERWDGELRLGAGGYLGTTWGMCDDSMFVALVRFESREAAERNSDRPEQGAWWAEAERCFDGPVTWMNCDDVALWHGGGSDRAGFVQVMEGRSSDRRRMREILEQSGDRLRELRPEIMGATFASWGDDGYVEAVYFTSEAQAREHERLEVPDDLRALLDEEGRLAGEVSYYDMHRPMLSSA